MALTLTKISPAVQAAPKPKLSMTALYNGLIDFCVLALFAFEEKLYIYMATRKDDPTWNSAAHQKFVERLGELTALGFINYESGQRRIRKFYSTVQRLRNKGGD